ncbi:MAG: futalosine hydrolase, partial [Bacteroidota bacterium]
MHILLVLATEGESGGLRQQLSLKQQGPRVWSGHLGDARITLLHTGIGMINTALYMGRMVEKHTFDRVVNLGIAGAFDRSLVLGGVIEVETDVYAELGADSPEGFLSLEALGFPAWQAAGQPGYNHLFNPHAGRSGLPLVRAITVNRVHGTAERIAKTARQWRPSIESMEGAAFLQVALEAGIPCTAIRSISNYVEPRNRAAWDIPAALRGLEAAAMNFL